MTLLAVSPKVATYSGFAGKTKLVQFLENQSVNTEVEPVTISSYIQLADNGETKAGKNRLSSAALAQICRAAAPGLMQLVNEVSGLSSDPNKAISPKLAINIYNSTIALRAQQLVNYDLVCNTKDRVIEGVVGRHYRYMANMEFIGLVDEAVNQSDKPYIFHDAVLQGRTMILTYRHDKPCTKIPEEYFQGFYFVNSEVGECSVHSNQALIRAATGDKALLKSLSGGKLSHIGKTFKARVRKSLNKLTTSQISAKAVATNLAMLPDLPLGFAGLNNAQAAERVEDISIKLIRLGFTNELASRVLTSALYQGKSSVRPAKSDLQLLRSKWGSRNMYDLFITLMREANDKPLSVREILQRVAYDVVMRRLCIF